MVLKVARVFLALSNRIKDEASRAGWEDRRLAQIAMTPPRWGGETFAGRCRRYRTRSVKEATMMLAMEYAGEWRALQNARRPSESRNRSADFANLFRNRICPKTLTTDTKRSKRSKALPGNDG